MIAQNDGITEKEFEPLYLYQAMQLPNSKTEEESPYYNSLFRNHFLKELSPQSPLLYGLPKFHKDSISLRPVVYDYQAPTNKLVETLPTQPMQLKIP